MKIVVLQSNFAKGLNQISRIVGSRATLPVLNNVLISAKKGKIQMSATNLEVGISTQVIGKIEEDGELTLPVRLLSDFVLNNKDESIELVTEAASGKLKSEHFEATIQGISAEEFPTVPKPPTEVVAKISRTKLIDAFKKVNIAAATDETRPVLAGIYCQFSGNKLTLAATDSYRLAEKKITLETEVAEQNLIVPLRTAAEVLRLISTEDGVEDVNISAKENQISFSVGNTYIVSRLIEGAFPNYSQIVPESFKITAKTKLSDILSAVKMSSLFARDSANNNVRVIVKKNDLTISSIVSESGTAKSSIASETTGGDVEIAFNARYMLDILNVISDEEIILNFNESTAAGAIKTPKDPDYFYIIMPLKLDS
jgi:DNA polymerase-3 subunit beta